MEELHACANFSVLRLWDYDEAAIMQLTEVSYTPECWGVSLGSGPDSTCLFLARAHHILILSP